MGRRIPVNTPEELAQVDLEFHEALVRAARHSRLLANWLSLSSQIRLVMVQRNLTDHDSLRGAVQGHTEFLAALQARDVGDRPTAASFARTMRVGSR